MAVDLQYFDLNSAINNVLNLIKEHEEDILLVAANTVLAEFIDRIFDKGLSSDGSKIGKYDTSEIWIKTPYPQVDNSRLKKKGKKGHKTKSTTYIGAGYKAFRDIVGRSSENVNLHLTGGLSLSIKSGKTGNNIVIGFVDEKQALKARRLEQKYQKDIFSLNEHELNVFQNAVSKEINYLLKQFNN